MAQTAQMESMAWMEKQFSMEQLIQHPALETMVTFISTQQAMKFSDQKLQVFGEAELHWSDHKVLLVLQVHKAR
jgi:hypothetical protein